MTDVAIKVESVGKKYNLGQKKHTDLRNSILSKINYLGGEKVEQKEFWALDNVSFEVKKGESVGVIGGNGAGKSTLLKIISRITHPTLGRIEINGRVSSLLEVGTGFHMELTGRENIFLNGTILGMRRKEIKRRFDEIVAFSGVEKFLDTPVKHYSSGMKVRLAFSVAAHLEPEILIVDEVLAVGDADFQRKCLGKMNEVTKEDGRTVLFVSHNMGAVENLCSRGVLLAKGELLKDDVTSNTIQAYLETLRTDTALDQIIDRTGLGNIKFQKVILKDLDSNTIHYGVSGQPLIIECELSVNTLIEKCRVSLVIKYNDSPLIVLDSNLVRGDKFSISGQKATVRFVVNSLPLTEGDYDTTLFVESKQGVEDLLLNKYMLKVEYGDFYGFGRNYHKGWKGRSVLINHETEIYSE